MGDPILNGILPPAIWADYVFTLHLDAGPAVGAGQNFQKFVAYHLYHQFRFPLYFITVTSSPTKLRLEGASTHSRDRHPRLVPRYTVVSQANTVRHSLQVLRTFTCFQDIHYLLSVTIFRPSYGFGHWNPVPNPSTYLLRKSLTLEHSAVRTWHIDSEPLYPLISLTSIKKASIHHLPNQNRKGTSR